MQSQVQHRYLKRDRTTNTYGTSELYPDARSSYRWITCLHDFSQLGKQMFDSSTFPCCLFNYRQHYFHIWLCSYHVSVSRPVPEVRKYLVTLPAHASWNSGFTDTLVLLSLVRCVVFLSFLWPFGLRLPMTPLVSSSMFRRIEYVLN